MRVSDRAWNDPFKLPCRDSVPGPVQVPTGVLCVMPLAYLSRSHWRAVEFRSATGYEWLVSRHTGVCVSWQRSLVRQRKSVVLERASDY